MCIRDRVAGIARVSITDVARELTPYLVALIGVLALITYVPVISLWLPHAFGFGLVR